jgi:hypothetical protein
LRAPANQPLQILQRVRGIKRIGLHDTYLTLV